MNKEIMEALAKDGIEAAIKVMIAQDEAQIQVKRGWNTRNTHGRKEIKRHRKQGR